MNKMEAWIARHVLPAPRHLYRAVDLHRDSGFPTTTFNAFCEAMGEAGYTLEDGGYRVTVWISTTEERNWNDDV